MKKTKGGLLIMAVDYERLFAENLREVLREEIIGSIFVKVVKGDKLYIHVQCYDDVDFEAYYENFSIYFLQGKSTQDYAREFLHEYRKYIIDQSFRKYFR